MLQFREALPHPTKENPFGVVVYLKLPNEPSLRIGKLLHGSVEGTHLLLTLPLRFTVEGPEVIFEQLSSLRAKYALPEESGYALKQMVLSHPYGRWVVRKRDDYHLGIALGINLTIDVASALPDRVSTAV